MRPHTTWSVTPSGQGFNARHYVVAKDKAYRTVQVFGDYCAETEAHAMARTLNNCSPAARELLCIRARLWMTCNFSTQQAQQKRMRVLASQIIGQ